MNIELLSLYHSILMHLQDALYEQQLELVKLRQGRDELTREMLKMQAERATPPAREP